MDVAGISTDNIVPGKRIRKKVTVWEHPNQEKVDQQYMKLYELSEADIAAALASDDDDASVASDSSAFDPDREDESEEEDVLLDDEESEESDDEYTDSE